jgi:hypothetical protein
LAQLILKDDLELAKYHKKAGFLLMNEEGPMPTNKWFLFSSEAYILQL